MKGNLFSKISLGIIICAVVFMFYASPVHADGGLIIPDEFLWASLTENQQIAVVTINRDNTAKIDLFISLQDSSGYSNEITYFLPLGQSPSNPQAAEMNSLDFDMRFTGPLDRALTGEVKRKQLTQAALLPGLVITHGAWLLPALVPLAFSGCSALTAPEATLNTPSSQINIYGLDTGTDITDLINTTGLDKSVASTLERLRGQKIAIIRLRTQPVSTVRQGQSSGSRGQLGLHFSWVVPAVSNSHSENPVFVYPLGTGSAWAKPIEITRVYVVGPRDMNFQVEYPELGTDLSGAYVSDLVSHMRNINSYGTSAYSIEDARDSQSRIWRATYRLSNAAEDIIITVNKTEGLSGWLQSSFPLRLPAGYTILIGILLSLLLWLLAWRYIIPRRIPLISYSWKEGRLWKDALTYPLLNLISFLILPFAVVAIGFVSFFLYRSIPIHIVTNIITGLLALAALLGILFIPLNDFLVKFRRLSEQSKGRLFMTYLLVVFSANAAYILIGLGYVSLTRAF